MEPGDRVADRYVVRERLGAGAMGVVYRAKDTKFDRDVALKMISAEFVGDGKAVARLLEEAKATAQLEHRHIVPVYDVGCVEGSAYLAMQLVAGVSLGQRLADGPLEFGEVIRIASEVADALAYAHDKGIVHRDIKPDNLMLRPDGSVVVLDFGLAKRTGSADAPNLTRDGTIVGTPAYASPEQTKGEPIDHRTDQFALAVTVWQLLVGALPWTGSTALAVYTSVLADPVPALSSMGDFPEAASAALDRALAKERDERFPSIREFAQALCGSEVPFAATMPEQAAVQPPETATSDDGPSSSRRLLMAAGFTGLLLLASFAVWQSVGITKPTLRVGVATEAAPTIRALLQEYDAQHPELSIEVVLYGSGRYEAARTDFANDEFDVVMVDDIWLPRFMSEGLFVELFSSREVQTRQSRGRFLGDMEKWGQNGAGVSVALPFLGNVLIALHRTELNSAFPYELSGYSIPVGARNDTRNNLVEVFLEALRAFEPGADGISIEDGEPLHLPRHASEQAARWLWDALEPARGAIRTEVEVMDDFCAGNSGVIVGWPLWVDSPDSCLNDAEVRDSLGVSTVSTEPILGAWYLGVRSSSQEPDLSRQIVLDLTTDSSWQERLGNAGNFVPVLSDVQPTRLRNQPFWNRNYVAVRNAFLSARPRPRASNWDAIEDELGTIVQTALSASSRRDVTVEDGDLVIFDGPPSATPAGVDMPQTQQPAALADE